MDLMVFPTANIVTLYHLILYFAKIVINHEYYVRMA